jgi:UDP-N-acetylmuramoyl-tripeptide--D-alanyl-D-alanine ligase
VELSSVSIDTRSIEPGALFVAIAGPNHDAHRFVADAVRAGALGLLVERARELDANLPSDLPIVATEDTTLGLGALAREHRALFDGPVIAITGSSGKTTTKEMCAAILAVDGPCLKTQGNLNNQYGLPLTLLRRDDSHRCVVVELGTNHRGEIAALAEVARPTVGLITNIGTAHIEFFGSREAIAEEKGALFAALGPEATAIVNVDDPFLVAQSRRAEGRVLHYGIGATAEVRAERVQFIGSDGVEFHLRTPVGEAAIHVPGLGDTTVINALAAAAATLAAGAPLESVRVGLAGYRAVAGRMNQRALANEVSLIDDTYNANPQSMRTSLESLARLKGAGRSIAVLGDMGELGESAEQAHREIGRRAAELETDFLFTLGEHAEVVAEAAVAAGMPASRVRAATEHDDISQRVALLLQSRDWILVKGSRSMKMERVVDALTAEESH